MFFEIFWFFFREIHSFMKSSTCFHLNKKCAWKDDFKGAGVEQWMENSQIESHLFSASIGFWQILWIDQEKQHAPLGMAFLPQIMALTFLFIIRGEHQGGCGGFCCLSRTGHPVSTASGRFFSPHPTGGLQNNHGWTWVVQEGICRKTFSVSMFFFGVCRYVKLY